MEKIKSKASRAEKLNKLAPLVTSPYWNFISAAAALKFGEPLLSATTSALTQLYNNYQQQALSDLVLALNEKVSLLSAELQEVLKKQVASKQGYILSIRAIDTAIKDPEKVKFLANYFVNALTADLKPDTVMVYMDVVEQLHPLDIQVLHEIVRAKRANGKEYERGFDWQIVSAKLPDVEAGIFHHSIRKLEGLGMVNKSDRSLKDVTHFLTAFGEDAYDFFAK